MKDNNKIIEEHFPRVTIEKIKDNRFSGIHPNQINVGYTKTNYLHSPIRVGSSVIVGSFRTSKITKIFEWTAKSVEFETQNSTYRLTHTPRQ